MAKTATEVDREKLQAAIDQAEKAGPLKNLDMLWKAVEPLYNGMSPPVKITHSVVKLRAEAWGLTKITIAGRKGKEKGVKLSDEQKAAMQAGRKSRGEKFKDDEDIQKAFVALRREVPKKTSTGAPCTTFTVLVDRAESGSLKAAAKLMCLTCASYAREEIKHCGVYNCPLYAFRPYKLDDVSDEDELVQLEGVEPEEVEDAISNS